MSNPKDHTGPTAKRIQRKRSRGWKMPPNTKYVGRPGKYGNPFRVGHSYMMGDPDPEYAGPCRMLYCEAFVPDARATLMETPEQAVAWYRRLKEIDPLSSEQIAELRGKNLACWCREGSPCHADVLLEMTNRESS